MSRIKESDLDIEQLHPVELDDLQGLTTDVKLFLDIAGKPVLYVDGPYCWSSSEIEKLHDDGFSVLFFTDESAPNFAFLKDREFEPEARSLEIVPLFDQYYSKAIQRLKVSDELQLGSLENLRLQLSDFISNHVAVQKLLAALSLHDSYSFEHSVRTVVVSHLIASTQTGQEPSFDLALAALLHDLGHLEISAEVLEKKGELTPLEWASVKHHPAKSLQRLDEVPLSSLTTTIILQHHERPDSRGYPRALTSADIVPEARIVSLADVFCALSSPRPYQNQLGVKQSIAFIESNLSEYIDEDPLRALKLVLQG